MSPTLAAGLPRASMALGVGIAEAHFPGVCVPVHLCVFLCVCGQVMKRACISAFSAPCPTPPPVEELCLFGDIKPKAPPR